MRAKIPRFAAAHSARLIYVNSESVVVARLKSAQHYPVGETELLVCALSSQVARTHMLFAKRQRTNAKAKTRAKIF